MKSKQNITEYLNSREFLLDTMIHREGEKFVYLEAIPREGHEMMWLNNHLLNCTHMVKHVGTLEEIANLLGKHLGIQCGQRKEFLEIMDILQDLPEVVNSNEEK